MEVEGCSLRLRVEVRLKGVRRLRRWRLRGVV